MKLGEYIKNLNEFIKENPKASDMEAITSIDDEGNGFKRIYYTPSLGNYRENDEEFNSKIEPFNAVCVN